MNNRIPIAILIVLVLVALIWRIANPPAPPAPGPLGAIPTWSSRTAVGEMGPSAVNPAGTMWAGAWNQRTASGELHSAVLIIDLEKSRSYRQVMKKSSIVPSLRWKDDGTVRALVVDSDDPNQIKTSSIALIRLGRDETLEYDLTPLKEPVARILAWPAGSDRFAAQLVGDKPARFAVLTESGEIVGKPAEADLPAGTSVRPTGAISPNGKVFVFAVAEDKVGGLVSYYTASEDGLARKAFSSADLQGRVEGIWMSPAGVLMVCAQREKFETVVYTLDTAVSALIRGAPLRIAGWPDAPASMMFATYNGGYVLNLATGKVKRLFDLTKQGKYSDAWRRQIQDGRLYPRKDGDYTSVSLIADEVDIRVIKKSGDKGPDILPRG